MSEQEMPKPKSKILGALYGAHIIREGQKRGELISSRQAGKLAGVSHVAVLKQLKKEEQFERIQPTVVQTQKNIHQISNGMRYMNRISCPLCGDILGFYVHIDEWRVIFTCNSCHQEINEEQFFEWEDTHKSESGNQLPKGGQQ